MNHVQITKNNDGTVEKVTVNGVEIEDFQSVAYAVSHEDTLVTMTFPAIIDIDG